METLERSDIDAARSLHRQLRDLLQTHERGEATEKTLQEIRRLCDYAVQAIGDPYCQERICEVERHSGELFAADKRSRWGSRLTQPGAMFLRRLIYRALDALAERVKSLEQQRRSGAGAAAASFIRTP